MGITFALPFLRIRVDRYRVVVPVVLFDRRKINMPRRDVIGYRVHVYVRGVHERVKKPVRATRSTSLRKK